MPENLGKVISLLATSDFSAAASQYLFMAIDANGKVVLPALNARAIGVLQNSPAAGQAGAVQIDGVAQVVAGAAVAAGALVSTNAAGQAITFVPGVGAYALGTALEAAGGAGIRFSVLLNKPYGLA